VLTTATSSPPDHPLLLFNREGDCLAAKLRPGNIHSADGWEELLLPEIDRQQAEGKEVAFRADAGRHLVADQLAAAVGENRRTTHQTRAYYWLLLAESHLTRQLFAAMLRKITMPPAPPG
jgi:hypothetical protein